MSCQDIINIVKELTQDPKTADISNAQLIALVAGAMLAAILADWIRTTVM